MTDYIQIIILIIIIKQQYYNYKYKYAAADHTVLAFLSLLSAGSVHHVNCAPVCLFSSSVTVFSFTILLLLYLLQILLLLITQYWHFCHYCLLVGSVATFSHHTVLALLSLLSAGSVHQVNCAPACLFSSFQPCLSAYYYYCSRSAGISASTPHSFSSGRGLHTCLPVALLTFILQYYCWHICQY